MIVVGGACFVFGAASFIAVFAYLAANFNYPAILDGTAAEVLPRLHDGGPTMRAMWAIYAFLPLLLIPGAVSTYYSCPSGRERMTFALVCASLAVLAMTLGLMRWPSIHWVLADAYVQGGPETKNGVAAVFNGLNLYLGTYVGEFLGEVLFSMFIALSGYSFLKELRFPKWLGWFGVFFSISFLAGAFRNLVHAIQPVADINNALLPLWLIVIGVMLIRSARYSKETQRAQQGDPGDAKNRRA